LYGLDEDTFDQEFYIYNTQDIPNVSQSLQGLWGTELDRSGLQISVGLFNDAPLQQQLFLSLLTYLDESPIWLSGGVNFADGSNSIELPLHLNSGPGFLEAGATATSTTVGTARLTVLGCNEIRLELDLEEPFGNSNTVWNRLNDQTFSRNCLD